MLGEVGTRMAIRWPLVSEICVPKIVKNQNPLILFKVTIDNVGVPFLRHSVLTQTVLIGLLTLYHPLACKFPIVHKLCTKDCENWLSENKVIAVKKWCSYYGSLGMPGGYIVLWTELCSYSFVNCQPCDVPLIGQLNAVRS